MAEFKRLHVLISGEVQGVFFRIFTQTQAEKLDLTGWVKNLPSEHVEVLAEGTEVNLKKLLEFLKKGSPKSKVFKIEVQWLSAKTEFKSFEIIG